MYICTRLHVINYVLIIIAEKIINEAEIKT